MFKFIKKSQQRRFLHKIRRAAFESEPEEFKKILQIARQSFDTLPCQLVWDVVHPDVIPQNMTSLLENVDRQCLDQLDPQGQGALHQAIMLGATELVAVLLQNGANPNLRDQAGVTPYILCNSMAGTQDMIDLLMAAGANPKLVDKTGKNYLM